MRQFFCARVAMYAASGNIGIALVDQLAQLLQVRLLRLEQLDAGAYDLLG